MERLRNLLQEIRPEIDFDKVSDFIQAGILDSFDIVMLVSAIDEAYNISIGGVDIVPENFADLESIRKLVLKYGGQP